MNKQNKKEQELILEVLKLFEGMNKIDVLDILHKMEVLLFYTKSPITKESIAKIINADLESTFSSELAQYTLLPSGNFCEFLGSNDWIHIYKEQKQGLLKLPFTNTYYFKTKYAPLELTKFTKKNILETVKGTPEELKVKQHLKHHRITKKNSSTKMLLILDI